MTRKFAKIERSPVDRTSLPPFLIRIKDATNYRHWPYRQGEERFATKQEAEKRAEQLDLIVLKRWCDAELTHEELVSSGYFSNR